MAEGAHRERVLGPEALDRVVTRLAHEIHDRVEADERGPLEIDPATLAIVGVRTGGAHLARRITTRLGELRGGDEPPYGVLDITLYRDDVLAGGQNRVPILRGTDIPFDIEGRHVVLVDDVLFTGRTVRAALDALLDLGRPGCVRLAVLVDRGLRELPVAADFTGRSMTTAPYQRVEVCLTEEGFPEDEIVLYTSQNRRASDGAEDA